MANFEELEVIETAQTGIISQQLSFPYTAVCIPGSFLYDGTRYVEFASSSELSSDLSEFRYLGVYDVETRNLVAYSDTLIDCDFRTVYLNGEEDGPSVGYYPVIYKLNTKLPAGTTDQAGFVFAFYKTTPPPKYSKMYTSLQEEFSLMMGARLAQPVGAAWSTTSSPSGLGHHIEDHWSILPYMLIEEDTSDEAAREGKGRVIFNHLGSYAVREVVDTAFDGEMIDIAPGQPLASFDGVEVTTPNNTNGYSIPVNDITLGEAWEQLTSGKFKNLYKSQGWVELLRFEMEDNWQWDICSIKPNNGVYTLCGRTVNGQLEWQFGNLCNGAIGTATNPDDINGSGSTEGTGEPTTDLQFNPITNKWEVVLVYPNGDIVNVTDSDQALDIDYTKGYTEAIADLAENGSEFNMPMLRWAGYEASKQNMLIDGKLRASCEPVYLGMFNVAMSYLAQVDYDRVLDSDCDKTCDTVNDVPFYEVKQEVSPVWFLFASIKDGLVNLVALQHSIKQGDSYGTSVATSDITDYTKLYGPRATMFGLTLNSAPPCDYSKFNNWLFTNFILPAESDTLKVTEDEATDEVPAGWYYIGDGRRTRIPDSLVESGCYSTPCPRWMAEHSVLDEAAPSVELPLCSFDENLAPQIFNNVSQGSRGFIDNTLHREYRWQYIDGKWSYVSYKDSLYIASAEAEKELTRATSVAYLPIGSRYSKSYASFTNLALRLVSTGRCISFDPVYTTADGTSSSVLNNVYVLSNNKTATYTREVFYNIVNAPVNVDAIAVTTGSTLVYDTMPAVDITDIEVFDEDMIGDGLVCIAKDAMPVDIATNEQTVTLNESILPDGFPIGVDILPSGSNSSSSNGASDPARIHNSYADINDKRIRFQNSSTYKSKYTGTLVLQGDLSVGMFCDEVDLTSYSNVVSDSARMYPRADTTKLNKITIPNECALIVTLPEHRWRYTDLVGYSHAITTSISDASNLSPGRTGSEGIIRSFVNWSSTMSESALWGEGTSYWAYGQGNGSSADLADIVFTDQSQLSSDYTSKFDFKSRPGYSGQYVLFATKVQNSGADNSEVDVHFKVNNNIVYSVWVYKPAEDTVECLQGGTSTGTHSTWATIRNKYTFENSEGAILFILWSSTPESDPAPAATVINIKDISVLYATPERTDARTLSIGIVNVDETGQLAITGTPAELTCSIARLSGSGKFYVGTAVNDSRELGKLLLSVQDTSLFDGTYIFSGDIRNYTQFAIADDGRMLLNASNDVVFSGYWDLDPSSWSANEEGLNTEIAAPEAKDIILTNDTDVAMCVGYVKNINTLTLGRGSVLRGKSSSTTEEQLALTVRNSVDLIGTVTIDNACINAVPGEDSSPVTTVKGTVISTNNSQLNFNDVVLDLTCGVDNFEEVPSGITYYNVDSSNNISYSNPNTTAANNHYRYIAKAINGGQLWDINNTRVPEGVVLYWVEDSTSGISGMVFDQGTYVAPTPEGDCSVPAKFASLPETMSSVNDWIDNYNTANTSYYIDKLPTEDTDRKVYYVGKKTITCCDDLPYDCCEDALLGNVLPEECNIFKNCGVVVVDPITTPGGGGGGGAGGSGGSGGNEEDDDNPPGGGGGGGGGTGGDDDDDDDDDDSRDVLEKWWPIGGTPTAYIYTTADTDITITKTARDFPIKAKRGNKETTFIYKGFDYKIGIKPNLEVSLPSVTLTGKVTLSLSRTLDRYSYPYGGNCLQGDMHYGFTNASGSSYTVALRGGRYTAEGTPTIEIPITTEGPTDLSGYVTIANVVAANSSTKPDTVIARSNGLMVKTAEQTHATQKVVSFGAYMPIYLHTVEISASKSLRTKARRALAAQANLTGQFTCNTVVSVSSSGPPSGPSIYTTCGDVTVSVGGGKVANADGITVSSVEVRRVNTNWQAAYLTGSVDGGIGGGWEYCTPEGNIGNATATISGGIPVMASLQ